MRAEDLLALRPALERYLDGFKGCATAPTRRQIRTYISGQLGPLERKSIEPIALQAGVPPRTLQELLSIHRWSEEHMRDKLLAQVQATHGGRHAIGTIDETSYVKKGGKTPGVQRQHCGTTGKTDNCVVTVHLGLADQDFHCLLDGELYLPESWSVDRARCRAAGIPDEMTYRSKWKIALELVDRAGSQGVEFGWFTFDEGYGGKPEFLKGLADRGQRYIGEVPKNFMGWLKRPRVWEAQEPVQTGRARVFPRVADDAPPARKVEDLLGQIDVVNRKTYHVKDTHKGPEVWHVTAVPFTPQIEGLPGPQQWLLGLVNVQTPEIKYFVSNAASGVPVEALVHVAFSRWHIERCFEDDKGEIGMDHFEVRTYRSLKRHLILSAVSLLFLAWTNEQLREKKSRVDGLPGEARDRVAA